MRGKKKKAKFLAPKIERKRARAKATSTKGLKAGYWLEVYCPKHGNSRVGMGQGCPGCLSISQ